MLLSSHELSDSDLPDEGDADASGERLLVRVDRVQLDHVHDAPVQLRLFSCNDAPVQLDHVHDAPALHGRYDSR